MKNIKYILATLLIVTLSGCSPKITKGTAYKEFYKQHPVSVLIMPPINNTTNVDAKEIFHSTLLAPLDNVGYYVIPPFLSMEILKRESAWDSELFINGSLNKFHEIFGADLALFTVITRWNKTVLSQVEVEVEYIIKSTKTNDVIYSRKGTVTYDTSINSGGGIGGLIANVALSAVNTAMTKYVDIAKVCNAYTLKDIPAGKYSTKYNSDSTEVAGKKVFRITLN